MLFPAAFQRWHRMFFFSLAVLMCILINLTFSPFSNLSPLPQSFRPVRRGDWHVVSTQQWVQDHRRYQSQAALSYEVRLVECCFYRGFSLGENVFVPGAALHCCVVEPVERRRVRELWHSCWWDVECPFWVGRSSSPIKAGPFLKFPLASLAILQGSAELYWWDCLCLNISPSTSIL